MWRKIQLSGKFSVIERIAVAAAPLAAAGAPAVAANDRHPLPDGFVHLDQAIPDLAIDLRYATANNFVGQRIDGYRHARAVMTAQGFLPYAQEWWHFTLSGELYPDTYFDFLSRRP